MAAKKFVQCHCCGMPQLPEGVTPWDTHLNAVECYPGNAPSDMLLASFAPGAGAGGEELLQAKITLLTGKWWGPKVDLSVGFMDIGASQTTLRNKSLAHMSMWDRWGDIRFRETADWRSADVRLATTPGDGHYAYLGTDMRLIPAGQKNLNLDSFSLSTPDSEYLRVVCHEAGHVLGCPHEQSRPEVLARLDRQKTYDFYRTRYGWSRATVDAQIFTPLDPNSIWATAPDETSIMCYQFPGQCTKNGQPIPGGMTINDLDGSLIAEKYPKDAAPVDPDEPEGAKGRVVIDYAGKTVTVDGDGWSLRYEQ